MEEIEEEERRKKNRQAYPLCPMCRTATRVSDFLRDYHGQRLDTIKVCCKKCIPSFEDLPKNEQLERLRLAMIKTYGETAVIYALQYDDTFTYHHIGRTKHFKRRMAEYRRRWDKPIKTFHVLEEIPFGPLSMERESRWILHALKHGWPIDNFDMFTPERRASRYAKWLEQNIKTDMPVPYEQDEDMSDYEKELHRKAQIIAAIADLEPLTAPFEEITPIIKGNFSNTRDMHVVHWLLDHYPEIRS